MQGPLSSASRTLVASDGSATHPRAPRDRLQSTSRSVVDKRPHFLHAGVTAALTATASDSGTPSWLIMGFFTRRRTSRDSMAAPFNPGRFCTSQVVRIARVADPMQSVSGPTAPLSARSVQWRDQRRGPECSLGVNHPPHAARAQGLACDWERLLGSSPAPQAPRPVRQRGSAGVASGVRRGAVERPARRAAFAGASR